MTCSRRIGFALLAVCLIASPVQGQFPWSKPGAAPEGEHRTGSIAWKTDLNAALKEAREKRKLVFVHFSGTHCPPCRSFEEKVLQRNDVAVTLLSKFIPVFVVVEQQPNLVQQYQVKGWPTDILLDAEGREIARQISPQEPREFIKRVSMIAAKHQAGQSATIANVRAAVAADVMEPHHQVQPTSGDVAQKPYESPRPVTKVVPNPHAQESALPPIVARNRERTPPASDEEEGFSPPDQRRRPPIVRKPRTAAAAPVARRPVASRALDELPEPAAESETEAAPWRKGRPARLLTDSQEVGAPDEPAPLKEVAEAETSPSTESPVEPSVEPSAEQGDRAASPPENAADEEWAPDTAAGESASVPAPASPPRADEAPAGGSRFTRQAESPSEPAREPSSDETPPRDTAPANEPAQELSKAPESSEAEAVEEETADPSTESKESLPAQEEASAEPMEAAPEEDPSEETTPAKPAATLPSADPPKSRFSGEDVAESEPASELESSAAEPQPPAEVAGETPVESPAEPTVQEAKSAPPVSEEGAEAGEANSPATGSADGEAMEADAESLANSKSVNRQDAPVRREEPPMATPPAERSPSDVEATRPAAPATPREEDAARGEETPRGLAKIARSGKYVLGGNCCVTLMEKEELIKGNPKFGAIHRGRIYLFCSLQARKKFLENPDDYSPMLSGYDPVAFTERGELIDGSPKILAVLDGGRVVSFANEETYQRFAEDYKQNRENSIYVRAVRTAMKETNGGRHFR